MMWEKIRNAMIIGTMALTNLYGGKALAEEPPKSEGPVIGNYALRGGETLSSEQRTTFSLGEGIELSLFDEVVSHPKNSLTLEKYLGSGIDLRFRPLKTLALYIGGEVVPGWPQLSPQSYGAEREIQEWYGNASIPLTAEVQVGGEFQFNLRSSLSFDCAYNNLSESSCKGGLNIHF